MTAIVPERVTALVPCHLHPPAEDLLQRLLGQVGSVLVIDDGMAPEAALALDRLADRLGFELLHLGSNRGKGHAIVAGLGALRDAAPAPTGVLVVDCDGQHPPEAIPRFLETSGAGELVVGNRFADGGNGMPPLRHACNRISSRIVSRRTRSSVPDSQCGMRLLHGRALHAVEFPGGGMESETRHLMDCLRAGVPVRWVPIPAIYDGQATSFRRVRDSAAVLRVAFAA